jgi:hypothetical protein
MKHLKLFLLLLFGMIALTTFTSCEKDNNIDSSSIIGTWENDQDWGACKFYPNGTCVLDGADADYTLKNGYIYFTYVGGRLDGVRDTYQVKKLTNSEMVWFTDDNYDEYADGLIYFVKVKD